MSSTQSSDFRVRTYMLLNTLEYMRETPATQGIVSQLPAAVTQAARDLAPGVWCPGNLYTEVLKQLAAVANGNDAKAQEILIEAGAHVAKTATNTFLRLLMKMLTPSLFAKKLPDFWKRDCTVGKMEVEVAPPTITCRYSEMSGFDHASCTGAGFLRYAFQGMGKSIQKIEISDWSLAKPAPEHYSIALTWAE